MAKNYFPNKSTTFEMSESILQSIQFDPSRRNFLLWLDIRAIFLSMGFPRCSRSITKHGRHIRDDFGYIFDIHIELDPSLLKKDILNLINKCFVKHCWISQTDLGVL